jgi:hypothetical protein
MKDMQEYVGQEIIGFEFRSTPYVDYCGEQEDQLGQIGKIIAVEEESDSTYSCLVRFNDSEDYETWYPMKNIDRHINKPIDLNQLFNQIKSL